MLKGALLPNVRFVDVLGKGVMEVVYDKIVYCKRNNTWLYCRNGIIVAITKAKGENTMDAKLTCSDGTEVAISKEAEASLKAAFGKEEKEKFEPINVYGTEIRIRDALYPIAIQINTDYSDEKRSGLLKNKHNVHSIAEARFLVSALQLAIEFMENK